MWLALPLVGLAIVIAAVGTLLVVAATGRPIRWLVLQSSPARLAPIAAVGIAIAAIVADLMLLGVLGGQAITDPRGIASESALATALVALAVAASMTRLALSARMTRRTLTARHARG
jgi:hypothetical protein